MNDNIYQDIFNILQDVISEDWKKLIFFAEYEEGSFSINYYITNNNKDYTDCYNLINVSESKLDQSFLDVDKILSPARKELDKNHLWTVMTMIVDDEGNMKVDFEYEDVSENFFSYIEEWEKRYLV